MEEIVTIPNPQPTPVFKTVQLAIPEDLHKDIVNEANMEGVNFSDIYLRHLVNDMNSKSLNKGKIVDISKDVLSQLANTVIETYKPLIPEVPADKTEIESASTPVTSEQTFTFAANPDLIELVNKINETRVLKGLAPLEKSFSEILFHYANSLSQFSAFEKTTGLNFDAFKAVIQRLALEEREANGAQSNVIKASGLFGTFSIVDTPQETKKAS